MKTINQIYNIVLETLLVEAMSLDEIFKKYYEKDLRISLETFKSINLIDPIGSASKKGKYLDWLIRKAYKENPRILEDSDKIKEDLDLFDKNYRHINKQITQIKDQYELAELVDQFREKKEKGEIDLSRSEIKKDIEKIYEDSDWLILTPKTEEAAKYYGKNTRWCTAAENDNYFDEHNEDGPLYILINKKVPDEKYQFHFQSDQYMDSEDKRISRNEYNQFPEKVLDKLIELAKKNNELVEFIMTLPNYIIEKYRKIYEKEYKSYRLGLQLINLQHRNNTELLEQVKNLVEKGANIHAGDDRALRNAASNGHLDVVKYLIEKGADIHADNDFALRYAAENGHLEIVKYLVEKGADVHVDNDETFRNAASDGYLEIVKYLVEKGADIHAEDDFALRWAAFNARFEIVKYLVEKGANIHAREDFALRNSNNKVNEYLRSIVDKEKNNN